MVSTGLSVEASRARRRSPEWATVHLLDHAEYYPGTSAVTLRVVFDPEMGLLLGAQKLGKNHEDKRIDVLLSRHPS
jgi:hypothetical protein